jgi:hypothetical protein
VTAFQQRDDGGVLLAAKAFELPAAPSFAHFGRHLRNAHGRADQAVQQQEADDDNDDERVLRQLDAVRGCYEQHVAGVEPEQQRQRHRGGGEQQERDQRAHGPRPA